jgi:nucleotide-binding universal stress UspA family protein
MRPQDRNRVTVGVDGSLASLAALREAVGQARSRHGELRVIHVRRAVRAPFTPNVYGLPAPGLPVAEIKSADHTAHRLIEICLQRAFGDVPADVSIDPFVAVGNPADVLCRQAWRDGDLLVIGTQGGRRWRHLRRVSVSRYCLAHASCAVLVVPRSQFADITFSRLSSDRPHLPHDLWREFDATGGEPHEPAR